MRALVKTWIAVSFVLVLLVSLNILNTYVSIKYEIDVYKMSEQMTEAIQDKKNLLNQLLTILWCTGIYLLLNISFLVLGLFKNFREQ